MTDGRGIVLGIKYGRIGRIDINEYDANILDAWTRWKIIKFIPSLTEHQYSLDMQHLLYWFVLRMLFMAWYKAAYHNLV